MVVRRLGIGALVAASLVVGGCVTNSASIYISGAVPVDSASCTYSTSSDVASSGSTADVALGTRFGRSLVVGFTVESLIRKRTFSIATDPSTVIVEEAEIELSDASGASVGGAFTVDVAGAVVQGSADGITPGSGVVAIPVMPASIIAGFGGITAATSIVATITLRGRTNGHLDVEGGPFKWLITLLPEGSHEVICDATSAVGCCVPGQDDEFYCGNVNNACSPEQ